MGVFRQRFPYPVKHRVYTLAPLLQSNVLSVDITSPLSGETVTTATPTITWALSTGVQLSYRVRVYDDLNQPALYDSGELVSATQSHVIPQGILDSDIQYYVIVTATLTTGAAANSLPVMFVTEFSAAFSVTGVTAKAIDSCNAGHGTFPHVAIRWTYPAAFGPGEVFQRFYVQRREVGGEWITIGLTTNIYYDDDTASSHIVYEYTVRYEALNGTATVLSSAGTVATAVLQFDHAWLSVVGDKATAVRLDSHSHSEEVQLEIIENRAWGRTAPTVHVGAADYLRFSVDGDPTWLKRPVLWAKLRALVSAQNSSDVLCVRFGRARTRAFCAITGAGRSVDIATATHSVGLVEISYDENLAAPTVLAPVGTYDSGTYDGV